MNRLKRFALFFLAAIVLLAAGCADEEGLSKIEQAQEDIRKTQNGILNRLASIEDKLKNIEKAIPPKRKPIDYNKVHNLPVGTSAVKGDEDGAVTITEFSDFQCPYCTRLQPTLNEVLKAYPEGVKLVYKDFPLSFHKQARNAAKAARAAGEQGKYWEMHDILFENYNKMTDDGFKEYASSLGLDVEKFMSDFSSNKYDKLIQQDINLGQKVEVRGTPTIFINGKRMKGRSINDFKTTIDGILKKK